MNSTSFSIDVVSKNSTNDSSPVVTRINDVVGTGISSSNTGELATIVKAAFLSVMAIGAILGNGLLLAAIQTTPSMWTKTNKILASLTVADFCVGFSMMYYVPSIVFMSVVNNPCRYNVMQVVVQSVTILYPYASKFNIMIVAIDRYVAIVHPLQYEMKMTDRVVTVMISAVWLISCACAFSYLLWLINADLTKCTIVPKKFTFVSPVIYALVGAVVVFVYAKILVVAWYQHIAIEHTTSVVVQQPGREVTGATPIDSQQEQKKNNQHKARKAEFKALRLTTVIIGAYLVLWLPYEIGRGLMFVGDTRPFVANMIDIGASLGMFNSSFNWILYGAVSKTYQKAFRRVLVNCLQPVMKLYR